MTSINGEIDQYGFERTEDFDYESYEAFMAEYLGVLARRMGKWDKMLKGSSEISRSSKVKRYIRKGIPLENRTEVWMNVSNAQQLKEKNSNKYKELLAGLKAEQKILDAIKGDIRRTYPENLFFKESEDSLLQALSNVLTAYACYDPNIGYCQGLNYIAGMLLLVTKDEENSFWLLTRLLQHLVPDFYSSGMLGLRVECRVLDELIKSLHPDLHAHFKTHNIDMELFASKWFVCLFTDVLPVETCLRLYDCLFYEGSKILLRAAITLIVSNKDKFMAETDFAKLCNLFKEIIRDNAALNCHTFMEQCFVLPKSLPRAKIEKLRSEARKLILEEK